MPNFECKTVENFKALLSQYTIAVVLTIPTAYFIFRLVEDKMRLVTISFNLISMFIVVLIIAVINLILGLFVLSKGFKRLLNQLFFLITIAIVFWIYSLYLANRAVTADNAILWDKFSWIASILIFLLFCFFVQALLDRFHIKNLLKTKNVAIAVSSLAIVTSLFIYLEKINLDEVLFNGIVTHVNWGSIFILYYICFASIVGYSLVNLSAGFIKSAGIAKVVIRYILFYFFGAIAVGSFFDIFLPAIGYWNLTDLGSFATLIFVIGTGVMIVKYRFLDIRLAFRKGMVFFASLASVVFIAFILIILIPVFYKEISYVVLGSSVIAICLLSFTFVLKFARDLFEKSSFNSISNRQDELKKLPREVAVELDSLSVADKIGFFLNKTFDFSGLEIFSSKKNVFKSLFMRDLHIDPSFLSRFSDIFESRRIFILDEIRLFLSNIESLAAKEEFRKLANFMKANKLAIVLPVVKDDELMGIILARGKKDGSIFFKEEINELKKIAETFGMALANSKVYEDIKDEIAQLEKQLAKQSEKSESEISSNLKMISYSLKQLKILLKDFKLKINKTRQNPEVAGYEKLAENFGSLSELVSDIRGMVG